MVLASAIHQDESAVSTHVSPPSLASLPLPTVFGVFFLTFVFIYLAAPALSCSTQGLLSLQQQEGSSVVSCKLLAAVFRV